MIKETELAQETKDKNILIITGNPPYSGASANKGIFEEEIRSKYKDSLEKEPLAIIRNGKIEKEKNPKWLLDDYVKFIRFAEMKLNKQKEGGIFGFISNNSFLDNPTFRGMRYSLLKSFDKIYILDLHGNVRKKEISPDGSKDENVFDIMQGVSINIFVRYSNLGDSNLAKVYHYDLFGKREDKYKFLFDNNLDNIEWKELKFEAPFFLFVPQDENKKVEYDKGYSVKDMFRISGVGICTKRDDIVFQNDKEKLKNLLNDFASKSKEELYKLYDIGKDSGGWKLDWAINAVKENKDNLDKFIIKCHYRPFDFRWTYYVNIHCGFMARPVYDIFEHFFNNKNNIGLVCDRGTKLQDISNIFISDKLIDLHLVGSGSYIFPLYIYNTENVRKILREENEEVGGMFEDIKHFENKVRIENFTPKFRKFINEKYGEIKPEEILGYIYAILFHKEYRKKYLDFLKIDFPKIPFVESKDYFLKFAKLGEELYNLHLGNLKIQKEVGEPMFKDNKNKNEKIVKAIYNENEKDLFVNESLYFKNVDKEVWEYKIGGYQVLDKYLKSHKNENIDYEHFENMIKILTRSIEIEAEISKLEF